MGREYKKVEPSTHVGPKQSKAAIDQIDDARLIGLQVGDAGAFAALAEANGWTLDGAENAPQPAAGAKKKLEEKPEDEPAENNDNAQESTNEGDPAKRFGYNLGMAIVGGRDHYNKLKNENTNHPAAEQPASEMGDDANLMSDFAPAAEAAKAGHEEKRFSNKLENKIGTNPEAAPKGMEMKQPAGARPAGIRYANTSRGVPAIHP